LKLSKRYKLHIQIVVRRLGLSIQSLVTDVDYITILTLVTTSITHSCVPPGKYATRAKKPRVEYTPGNAYTTTSPFSPKLGERSGGKAQIEKEAMKKRKR
jgi:hypothetical protein